MHILSLPLLVLAVLTTSQAAMAFNCIGITLPSSMVICSDPDLTRLADERQQIYNETRSRLAPDQQNALWEDQKAWVRSYATDCGVVPDKPLPSPVPSSVIDCFKRAAEARSIYLRSYGPSGTAASKTSSPTSADPAQTKLTDVEEVALVQAGRLFEIPVRINGAITLNFIIDSGASDVQIPADVFSTLVRANTIVPSDLMGEQTYVLADGSKQKAPKFLIRELKIGNHVIRNVPGGVGSATGSLLLGQSFLSHFDSWTVDNKRHVLKLAGRATEKSEPTATDRSSSSSEPIASLAGPPSLSRPSLTRSITVCGKTVEYTLKKGKESGFLGVWIGNWNNSNRLCGSLIVENVEANDAPLGIGSRAAANVTYIYGPSQPGSRVVWKRQHPAAYVSDNVLSFRDDQGGVFDFYFYDPNTLMARFGSGPDRLKGTFQKAR